QGPPGGRELLEPGRRPEEDRRAGRRRGGGPVAAVVLDAGAAEGARLRLDPRPLRLDLRRPALPRAAAARHRLGGAGAGGSLQQPGHARGPRQAVRPTRFWYSRYVLHGRPPNASMTWRTRRLSPWTSDSSALRMPRRRAAAAASWASSGAI